MADLTAIGMYVRYWAPGVPQWLPELIALGSSSLLEYGGCLIVW